MCACMHVCVSLTESAGCSDSGQVSKDLKNVWEMAREVAGGEREGGSEDQ